MKKVLLAVAVVVCFTLSGFTESAPSLAKAAARPKARNRAFEPVVDDPKLPRVLLIGDSISIGYTVPVRDFLKGIANVHRNAGNGGPTTNGLAHLKQWLGNDKWDVIHFNWGLHDLKFMSDGKRQVDTKAYEKNLRKLVRELKRTKAKLIWATTTPVPEGVTPPRKNEDVLTYNSIARKIMEKNKISVDDLYAFALPRLAEIQQPANVHFTPQGSAVLAKQVAASVESALGGKKYHRSEGRVIRVPIISRNARV